ncbi:hypothetical protein CCH79_00013718, partial [Gambusia affinis]
MRLQNQQVRLQNHQMRFQNQQVRGQNQIVLLSRRTRVEQIVLLSWRTREQETYLSATEKFRHKNLKHKYLIRDVLNVSEMTMNNPKPSSVGKYRALRCGMEAVSQSSLEFQNIAALLADRPVQIQQIIRVSRAKELQRFRSEIGNIKPLLHASRPSNFVGILSRGLLLPRAVVEQHGITRTDYGKLGSGIYFGDAVRSERWQQVKKAVDWVRWADREYPCACSRLEFGWSWESSTRQLLGFERFPPFSPLISLELQKTAAPLALLRQTRQHNLLDNCSELLELKYILMKRRSSNHSMLRDMGFGSLSDQMLPFVSLDAVPNSRSTNFSRRAGFSALVSSQLFTDSGSVGVFDSCSVHLELKNLHCKEKKKLKLVATKNGGNISSTINKLCTLAVTSNLSDVLCSIQKNQTSVVHFDYLYKLDEWKMDTSSSPGLPPCKSQKRTPLTHQAKLSKGPISSEGPAVEKNNLEFRIYKESDSALPAFPDDFQVAKYSVFGQMGIVLMEVCLQENGSRFCVLELQSAKGEQGRRYRVARYWKDDVLSK